MDQELEDYKIKVEKWSLLELYDVVNNIDQEKYPERFIYLQNRIANFVGKPIQEELEKKELSFSKFGDRVEARIVDGLIFLPLIIINMILYKSLPIFCVYLFNIIYLLQLSYYVYFHYKFGATFGKHRKNLMVTQLNNDKISFFTSIIRYLPNYLYLAFSFFGNVAAIQNISNESLSQYSFLNHFAILSNYTPPLFKFLQFLTSVWFFADIIVFLSNRNRRSLHDLIAKTKVIYKTTKISLSQT